MKGFLIINKPEGITSFAVVKKVRYITKIKKIGHAGTLDPFAEGVLVLCMGKATRLCSYFLAETKEYIATIKMGFRTDTLDIDGEILEKREIQKLSKENLALVAEKMLLLKSHIPPKYSAKKVDGKRAYDMARKNIDFQLESVPIRIYDFEILSYESDTITYKTKVSKGTYIRVLSEILAKFTGNIATTIKLKRIKSGKIGIDNAIDLSELTEENWEKKITPIEKILNNREKIYINSEDVLNFKNGRSFEIKNKGDIQKIMVCAESGECIGFADILQGVVLPKMVLI